MEMHGRDIGELDISEHNVMKRYTGQWVLTDPFWVGETPYQRHDRLLKAEIGYDDYVDDYQSHMISGGQIYKKKKIKPVFNKNKPMNDKDDTPF